MSIIKMRGPINVRFAFKIFSLPVPTRPGTRTFWQVPDPTRPEVKNPYPSDPGCNIATNCDQFFLARTQESKTPCKIIRALPTL